MPERSYAFTVGQSVQVRNGPVGKIVARDADPDALKVVEISPANVREFEGRKIGERVELRVPVNAYRVEFTGDNGRPDHAWWQEDMLSAP